MHCYAVRASAKSQVRMGHTAQATTLLTLAPLHLIDGNLSLAQSCLDAAMSMWDQVEAPALAGLDPAGAVQGAQSLGEHEAAAAYVLARKAFHNQVPVKTLNCRLNVE
jgi:hypothetical protein